MAADNVAIGSISLSYTLMILPLYHPKQYLPMNDPGKSHKLWKSLFQICFIHNLNILSFNCRKYNASASYGAGGRRVRIGSKKS